MAEPNPNNPPAPPADGNPPAPAPAGITPEQLHQQIEKARLEEREKLRAQLSASDETVKNLKAEVSSLTEKLTKLTDKITSLTAGTKPDGGVDVEKAIESAVKATADRLGQEYASQIQTLRGELETERKSRQQLTLEQRRSQMIQEAGGDKALIPELVTGSNEEELKTSVEKSKQIFQRTVATAGNAAPSLPPNNGSGAGNPPAPPAVPAGAAAAGGAPPAPIPGQRMSMADYAKNRQQLKKQAAARYPTGAMQ